MEKFFCLTFSLFPLVRRIQSSFARLSCTCQACVQNISLLPKLLKCTLHTACLFFILLSLNTLFPMALSAQTQVLRVLTCHTQELTSHLKVQDHVTRCSSDLKPINTALAFYTVMQKGAFFFLSLFYLSLFLLTHHSSQSVFRALLNLSEITALTKSPCTSVPGPAAHSGSCY